MSATVREQILAGLTRGLAAALNPIPVARNQDAPQGQFPAVVVLDGGHTVTAEESYGVDRYDLEVLLEGFVQTVKPADLGPALDELYGAVLVALLADRTVGGLAVDVVQGDLAVEIVRERGAPPTAGFSLAGRVLFQTPSGDPFTVGAG